MPLRRNRNWLLLWLGRLGGEPGRERQGLSGGLVLIGLVLVGYSRTTLPPVAIGVLAVAGLLAGAINTVVTPLRLGATPQHLLGRVIAVVTPVQQLAAIGSIALAGSREHRTSRLPRGHRRPYLRAVRHHLCRPGLIVVIGGTAARRRPGRARGGARLALGDSPLHRAMRGM